MEELRYEQERLRWQLNQAAHLGSTSAPVQAPAAPAPTSASDYCSHSGTDRYIIAKHTEIYPTSEDVSLMTALTCCLLWYWSGFPRLLESPGFFL